MKASELRIGNLVQHKDTKEITTIYALEHRYKRVYWINSSLYNNDSLEPIPLTEEWLLKFGFVKEDEQDELLDTFMYNKDNITRVEFSNKHKLLYWHDNYTSIYHQKLKHVHQLQNLYFALTGEELTNK